MITRVGWRWLGVSAAGGALAALGMVAALLLGSGTGWADLLELRLAGPVATIAGAGALAGAAMALPGVGPRPLVHPGFGLGMLLAFGNVDWLRAIDGPEKGLAQLALLATLVIAGARLKDAGPGPGIIAGAGVVAMALTPITALTWKDATASLEPQWWFEEPGLGGRMRAQAAHIGRSAGGLPDIYLVVPDRHPSPSEAKRRGIAYPEEALARLRARGWQIRDEARTATPETSVTFASTLALTTTITDGTAVETAPGRIKTLYDAGRLRWRRAFAQPLLLDVLARAGYETQGWIGWWLPSEAIPFDRVDRLRRSWLGGSLGRAAATTWRSQHLAGLGRSEERGLGHVARSRWTDCHEVVSQRERFFATDHDDRKPGPLFVLYHAYWLHDMVEMDAAGACTSTHEDAAAAGPYGRTEAEIAQCGEETIERGADGPQRAAQCAGEVARAGAMMAYLPAFLERLEAHARRNAGRAGFRILVLSDEGLTDEGHGVEHDPTAWGTAHERKHPAVLRATYAEGVRELWEEQAIPDVPQAMRAVVEEMLD